MRHAGGAVAWGVAVVLLLSGCGRGRDGGSVADADRGVEKITVTSTAFAEAGTVPDRYTCEGENVSPPLAWLGVPAGTAEVAVVVTDPDAPGGTFAHWVVFALPPTTTSLAEGEVPPAARQAVGSSEKTGWVGPCPPNGDDPHRYRFEVYAARRALEIGPDPVAARDVLAVLGDAATAKGTLTATFGR